MVTELLKTDFERITSLKNEIRRKYCYYMSVIKSTIFFCEADHHISRVSVGIYG